MNLMLTLLYPLMEACHKLSDIFSHSPIQNHCVTENQSSKHSELLLQGLLKKKIKRINNKKRATLT